MATKLFFTLSLSLLVSVAIGQQSTQIREARQCRIQRISASQPSQRIESEGGVIELWDENEDQFQCAGVAPLKITIQPNALQLPNFHPSPRLLYIQQGEGYAGISRPGCPETYHSQEFRNDRERQEEEGEREGRSRRDQHQRVQRVRRGDILAVPAGEAHWCYNDGDEDLVVIAVNDLNNPANQLDQRQRAFYLAGGLPKGGQQQLHQEQGKQTFENIFRGFDEELLAEALNIPRELARKMQQENDRGLIVNVREGLSMIRPDEEGQGKSESEASNGMEETLCSMKVRTTLNRRTEADIYSRQAGRLNIVNRHKLPILEYLDMSANRGHLFPDALYAPHWSINAHTVVYVNRGDAQVEIVGNNGETVMNERVKQGDLFVIPQYFAATAKAGSNGFKWVSFKTNSLPMNSPLSGYTSVMRAIPLQVITNSYQVSPDEAQNLKLNSGSQTLLLSPQNRSQ
ncbi:unnamed protein product [Ilex paraguariensis]|uniref:Cupin type-1 domain-containing protein n=1 Tax=Ilex paraguariensis TaxID=185542 RepID=A0ABC8RYF1_9AQUA